MMASMSPKFIASLLLVLLLYCCIEIDHVRGQNWWSTGLPLDSMINTNPPALHFFASPQPHSIRFHSGAIFPEHNFANSRALLPFISSFDSPPAISSSSSMITPKLLHRYRRPTNRTIRCAKMSERLPHWHCNRYWKCSQSMLAVLHMCPPHQRFDLTARKCVLAPLAKCFDPKRNGALFARSQRINESANRRVDDSPPAASRLVSSLPTPTASTWLTTSSSPPTIPSLNPSSRTTTTIRTTATSSLNSPLSNISSRK